MNIYIFYKAKDGQNKLKQFDEENNALRFIFSENIDIALCEVFEVKRILEFGFISRNEAAKKEELKCTECGGRVSSSAYTGKCHSCSSKSRMGTRLCEDCGKVKIADWNKAGLCLKCRNKYRNEKQKRKKKTETKEEKVPIQVQVDETKSKEETIKEVEEPSPSGKIAKVRARGKCRKCKKEFKLEDWQHSSMHWCSECRKHPDYKNYVDD